MSFPVDSVNGLSPALPTGSALISLGPATPAALATGSGSLEPPQATSARLAVAAARYAPRRVARAEGQTASIVRRHLTESDERNKAACGELAQRDAAGSTLPGVLRLRTARVAAVVAVAGGIFGA